MKKQLIFCLAYLGLSLSACEDNMMPLELSSSEDIISIESIYPEFAVSGSAAADVLSQGAGTIAEVSFLVGFNEPSYFTKCFQKEYVQTPSEFVATSTLKIEKTNGKIGD